MGELFQAKYGMQRKHTVIVTDESIIFQDPPSAFTKTVKSTSIRRSAIVSVSRKKEWKPGLGSKGRMDIGIALQDGRKLEVDWLQWADGQKLAELLGG